MKKASANELIADLHDRLNVATTSPPFDEEYVFPAYDWLVEFGRWLAENHPAYVAESFDCDDEAQWAQVQASRAIAMSHDLRGSGHAVRMCVVTVEEGGNLNGVDGPCTHATLLAQCDDGQWYFLEPQNGRITDARKALDSLDVRNIDFVLL